MYCPTFWGWTPQFPTRQNIYCPTLTIDHGHSHGHQGSTNSLAATPDLGEQHLSTVTGGGHPADQEVLGQLGPDVLGQGETRPRRWRPSTGATSSLIDQNWHKYVLIFFNIYDNQIENYSKVKINDSFFSQLSLNNWTIKFDSVLFGLVGLIENNFPSVRASFMIFILH